MTRLMCHGCSETPTHCNCNNCPDCNLPETACSCQCPGCGEHVCAYSSDECFEQLDRQQTDEV